MKDRQTTGGEVHLRLPVALEVDGREVVDTVGDGIVDRWAA